MLGNMNAKTIVIITLYFLWASSFLSLASAQCSSFYGTASLLKKVSSCKTNDGSVRVRIYGGRSPYRVVTSSLGYYTTYLSEITLSNQRSGALWLTIRDDRGCEEIDFVNVEKESALTATVSRQPSCPGASTGSASFIPSGGNGNNYQIKVDNGAWQSSMTVSGLAIGDHTYMVKDSVCESSFTFTIDSIPVAQANVVSEGIISCYGKSDGVVSLSASGGSGTGYQISFNNGAWGSKWTYDGLAVGTYTFSVRDSNSCASVSSVRVASRSAVVAKVAAVTQPRCTGTATGSAELSVSGGTETGYKIEFQGSTISQASWKATSLIAGTYSFTVKDSNDCSASESFAINPPTEVKFERVQTTPVRCSGTNTGSVALSARGGNSTFYQYKLGTGAWIQQSQYNDLAVGNYTVYVRDANLCEDSSRAEIRDRPALSTRVSTQNITCSGNTNGQFSFDISGGSGNYRVSIDGGTFTNQVQYTNLASKTYSYVIQDSNQCEISGSVIIHPKTPVQVQVDSISNETCAGTNSGAVGFSAVGGLGSGYRIAFDSTTYGTKWTYDKLAPGTYTVRVRDGNSCTSQPVSVTISPYPEISATATTTRQDRCEGEPTGTITITAVGGSNNFTYSLNDGAFTIASFIWGLDAGSYKYTVKDSQGCKFDGNATVQPPISNSITATVAITYLKCNTDGNIGEIAITASGGTAPYFYSKDGGNTNTTTPSFKKLAPGSYVAMAIDQNNCKYSIPVTIPRPVAITSTPEVVDLVCSQHNNTGQISINARGGSAPYSYSIDGGASFHNSSVFRGLNASAYNYVVKDSLGCAGPGYALINRPQELVVEVKSPPPLCYGRTSSITLNVTGGYGQYDYIINNKSVTAGYLQGLTPGYYSYKVTDVAGCSVNGSVSITDATVIQQSAEVHSTCSGQSNGKITITASGGAGSLKYSLDGFEYSNGNVFTGLPFGVQEYYVRDTNGCVANGTAVIGRANTVSANIQVSGQKCYGTATGSIFITPFGGNAGVYSLSVDGTNYENGTQFTYDNLSPGSYGFSIKDSYGCTGYVESIVTSQLALTSTVNVSDVTCFGNGNGLVSISATGGTGEYYFSLNNSTFTSNGTFTVFAGTYEYTIRDSNSCNFSEKVSVEQPQQITAIFTSTLPVCHNESTGVVTVRASGGVGTLYYSIDNNIFSESNIFTNISAGVYYFYVKDSNGCSHRFNYTMPVNLNNGCHEYATCFSDEVVPCVCKPGFKGNGTFCEDIDECAIGAYNCSSDGAICVNSIGSHSCQCKPGYAGNAFNCTELPSCSKNNGGCDYRVTCYELSGNITQIQCGPCPNGTRGDGKTGCELLCGDGTCEPEAGEDCVTCTSDCDAQSCAVCGDLVCDSNESCESCFQDCKNLCAATCESDCNGRGTCDNGKCECQRGWTGPTCSSQSNQPITVIVHDTNPNIGVESGVHFSVTIKALSEIDRDKNVIRSIDVSQLNFTLQIVYVGNNTKYNYSTTLENGASLSTIIWRFEEPVTEITFANETRQFDQHTIKLNFQLFTWPFLSLANSIAIQIESSADGEETNCVNDQQDASGSVQWMMVSVGNVSFYGQFVDKAIVDNRIRTISYSKLSDTVTAAIIPHFWEFADLDPHYSVLLGDSNTKDCSSDSVKGGAGVDVKIIAIVVPVVVVSAALVGLAVIMAPKIADRWKLRQLKKDNDIVMESPSTDGSSSL